MQSTAVLVNKEDNVATATKDLSLNEKVIVQSDDSSFEIEVKGQIAFGHKFSLSAINIGDNIIKYGEIIGIATKPISQYEHVHVHNVDSVRGTFTNKKDS